MCKNILEYRVCELGDQCSFAHTYDELKKKTHLPSNFKTKICENQQRQGYCQYGERCQFLHSIYDLNGRKLGYKQGLKEAGRLTLQRM